jgi:hypothetical protein
MLDFTPVEITLPLRNFLGIHAIFERFHVLPFCCGTPFMNIHQPNAAVRIQTAYGIGRLQGRGNELRRSIALRTFSDACGIDVSESLTSAASHSVFDGERTSSRLKGLFRCRKSLDKRNGCEYFLDAIRETFQTISYT